MTNYNQPVRILSIILLSIILCLNGLWAQENEYTLSGVILESGSGIPVQQAVISVTSDGTFTNTDDDGKFNMKLASKNEVLTISYPGYHTTDIFINGETEITIYLTDIKYSSNDELYTHPLGSNKIKNSSNAITLTNRSAFVQSAQTTPDQNLVGKVAGLNITEHSGMPGHKSYINLRGISSMYARNQPLVFVDGMIHEIDYSNNEIIEGHLLNPFDLIDVDDVVSVSTIKDQAGYLGSAGSNGVLNINTEQNEVTSASILVKMYGGISLPYAEQEVLNTSQYESYFTSILHGEGMSDADINAKYPWLNGNSSSDEYYRYNNNTDWQKESTKTSALQKYYIFLKGGDDIATYNISSGYTRHGSAYDDWYSAKFNLRLNGKINISKKLYIIPNTKLALTDSYLSNMGPTVERNSVTSNILKPSLMYPYEKSPIDGTPLYPIDDVGAFNMSNPTALITNSLGSTRNFQFLSSINLGYNINSHWNVSYLIGISMNNDRQNIFVPDVGVVQIDSAKNNPMDMVTEFRSTQNHAKVTYTNTFDKKHHITGYAGLRTMNNTYKNNFAIDLNTASDDFRSLGAGSEYDYLRSHGGEASSLTWTSYYGDFNYRYNDKYYLRASLSFDGSSAFNEANRYNFYPSLSGAWRIGKEDYVTLPSWINDFKLRVSAAQTGNMFSDTYMRSKTTYTGRRYGSMGATVLDYVTNEDLSAEKKFSASTGFDLSFNQAAYNLHVDYHMSRVNNLIINQSLPYNYGYTDYYDNGGKLATSGLEVGGDGRWYLGDYTLLIDGAITYQTTKIKAFEFVNPETEFIINEVEGAEYVAMVGNAVNAFYGYETDGVYNSDSEANGMVGPNGWPMEAGDVKFVDVSGPNGTPDGVINSYDKQIIGDPNPDLFGSFNAALNYKRFSFSALFTYSVGNDIYNYVRYKASAMDSYANQSVDVLDRWQPGSTDATLPQATMGDPKGNNAFSDRWIEDGSYLRVRQLTLSYTTPNVFSLKKPATIYITGSNLFTFTKYSGYDPVNMYQSSPYYMGIDYGKIPLAQSIILGIQLSL